MKPVRPGDCRGEARLYGNLLFRSVLPERVTGERADMFLYRRQYAANKIVSGVLLILLRQCVGWHEELMPEQVQHTLHQVSTTTALVEGIYQGGVQVPTLREHGDSGLGTFEGPHGEMVSGCTGPRTETASRIVGVN